VLKNPFIEVTPYSTLVCVGADAKQVIPLLMEVAVSKPTDRKHSNESPYAISALGGLGKYDPQTVVPFLIRLLEQPSHTRDAARALGTMGHAARDSVPALRQHLTAAVSGDDIDSAAIFIAALARVGSAQTSVPILVPLLQKPDLEYSVAYALSNIGHPATAAVPALIARLKENGTQNANDRYMDIAALISIDERSRAVLDVLLPEATSDKLSNLEVFAAATALAEVNPLPAEFAPALKSAMNRPGTDPIMKGLFERALINAHSQPSS
jgi:hypothetical protein